MATIAKRNPSDSRLVYGAFRTRKLAQAVDDAVLTQCLQDLAGDVFNGEIAETNAYDFLVEDAVVVAASYDASNGILELNIAFQYAGEQDPDRP